MRFFTSCPFSKKSKNRLKNRARISTSCCWYVLPSLDGANLEFKIHKPEIRKATPDQLLIFDEPSDYYGYGNPQQQEVAEFGKICRAHIKVEPSEPDKIQHTTTDKAETSESSTLPEQIHCELDLVNSTRIHWISTDINLTNSQLSETVIMPEDHANSSSKSKKRRNRRKCRKIDAINPTEGDEIDHNEEILMKSEVISSYTHKSEVIRSDTQNSDVIIDANTEEKSEFVDVNRTDANTDSINEVRSIRSNAQKCEVISDENTEVQSDASSEAKSNFVDVERTDANSDDLRTDEKYRSDAQGSEVRSDDLSGNISSCTKAKIDEERYDFVTAKSLDENKNIDFRETDSGHNIIVSDTATGAISKINNKQILNTKKYLDNINRELVIENQENQIKNIRTTDGENSEGVIINEEIVVQRQSMNSKKSLVDDSKAKNSSLNKVLNDGKLVDNLISNKSEEGALENITNIKNIDSCANASHDTGSIRSSDPELVIDKNVEVILENDLIQSGDLILRKIIEMDFTGDTKMDSESGPSARSSTNSGDWKIPTTIQELAADGNESIGDILSDKDCVILGEVEIGSDNEIIHSADTKSSSKKRSKNGKKSKKKLKGTDDIVGSNSGYGEVKSEFTKADDDRNVHVVSTDVSDMVETLAENAESVLKSEDLLAKTENILVKSESEKELSGFKESIAARVYEQYRVESPKELIQQKVTKNNKTVKSRSLDAEDENSEDMFEITEADSLDDVQSSTECQAVISEVESEIDWETTEDFVVEDVRFEETKIMDLDELAKRYDSNLLDTSSGLGPVISDFRTLQDVKNEDGNNTSEVYLNDMKSKKAKKRAALESHFLPQLLNPRYLDVIQEESESSGSKRNSCDFLEFMKNEDFEFQEEDPDDDVFEDDPRSAKRRHRGPQEIMRDWSSGRVLNRETGELITVHGRKSQKPECLLVGTKLLDTDMVLVPHNEMVCGDWSRKSLEREEQTPPEVVYLEDVSTGSSNGSCSEEPEISDSTDVSYGDAIRGYDLDKVDVEPGNLVLRGYDALTREALCSKSSKDLQKNRRDVKGIDEEDVCEDREKTLSPTPENLKGFDGATFSKRKDVFEEANRSSSDREKTLSPTYENVVLQDITTMRKINLEQGIISEEKGNRKESSIDREKTISPLCDEYRRDSLDSPDTSSHCSSRMTCIARLQSLDEPQQMDNSFAEIPGTSPDSLRVLCLRAIVDQPYGEDILQELAEVARGLDGMAGRTNENAGAQRFVRDVKVTTPPVGLSRNCDFKSTNSDESKFLVRRLSAGVSGGSTDDEIDRDRMIQEDSGMKSPDSFYIRRLSEDENTSGVFKPTDASRINFPVVNNDPWIIGVPTKNDPGVVMCLSKKQSELRIEPDSADAILDLHSKYLDRVSSQDFGVLPKVPKRKKKLTEAVDDDKERLKRLYKSEIRKTESSISDSDKLRFKRTAEEPWQDPDYTSDDRTRRLLKNELLRTSKSSCSIPFTVEDESIRENDLSSLDRLNRLYKSEMRLAQPLNLDVSVEDVIRNANAKLRSDGVKDNTWINVYDASKDNANETENAEARLNAKNLQEWMSSVRKNTKEDLDNSQKSTDRRRFSLPKELHEKQMMYILDKEREIQKEIDDLKKEKELLRLEELANEARKKSEEAAKKKIIPEDSRRPNRVFTDNRKILEEIEELDDCVERLEKLAEEANKQDSNITDSMKLNDQKSIFDNMSPHQRLLKEIEDIERLQYPLVSKKTEDFEKILKDQAQQLSTRFQDTEKEPSNPFKSYLEEKDDFNTTDFMKTLAAKPKLLSKVLASESDINSEESKEHIIPVTKDWSTNSMGIFKTKLRKTESNDNRSDKTNVDHDQDTNLNNIGFFKTKLRKTASQEDESINKSNVNKNIKKSPSKVIAKTPDEELREQMYSEYMSKVAEREHRKQQKVIKLSRHEQETVNAGTSKESVAKFEVRTMTRIENEFMNKVRERHDKLGINWDEDEEANNSDGPKDGSLVSKIRVLDEKGENLAELQKLPRHLQEFAELTTDDLMVHDDDYIIDQILNDHKGFADRFFDADEMVPPRKHLLEFQELKKLVADDYSTDGVGLNVLHKNVQKSVHSNVHSSVHTDVHKNVPIEVQNNVNKNVQTDVHKNVQKDVLKDVHKNVPIEVQSNICKNVQNNVQKNVQKDVHKEVQKEVQNKVQSNVHTANVQNNVEKGIRADDLRKLEELMNFDQLTTNKDLDLSTTILEQSQITDRETNYEKHYNIPGENRNIVDQIAGEKEIISDDNKDLRDKYSEGIIADQGSSNIYDTERIFADKRREVSDLEGKIAELEGKIAEKKGSCQGVTNGHQGESKNRMRFIGVAACVAVFVGWKLMKR